MWNIQSRKISKRLYLFFYAFIYSDIMELFNLFSKKCIGAKRRKRFLKFRLEGKESKNPKK